MFELRLDKLRPLKIFDNKNELKKAFNELNSIPFQYLDNDVCNSILQLDEAIQEWYTFNNFYDDVDKVNLDIHQCNVLDITREFMHYIKDVPIESIAVLLFCARYHDIGKLKCEDKTDHAQKSAQLVKEIMDESNIKLPEEILNIMLFLLSHHSDKGIPYLDKIHNTSGPNTNYILLAYLIDADILSKYATSPLLSKYNDTKSINDNLKDFVSSLEKKFFNKTYIISTDVGKQMLYRILYDL